MGWERRWGGIGARCPQTSQTHSFPGRQPPGLLRCGDLCPAEPAVAPRRPHLAATRPGQLLAIWKEAESGADCLGLQVGREELDPGAYAMVSFLSRSRGGGGGAGGAFLGLGWGCALGRGSGSARPGKGRRLSSGASHRAALPTQLLLLLPAAQPSRSLPGPAPTHSTWEGRNPAAGGKQQLGKG